MPKLRIAACQINPVVGDLQGNVDRIVDALAKSTAMGADVAVFPELAVTGYPPEDLLLKPKFIRDNLVAIEQIASATTSCVAVVGFVDQSTDLHNAAAICSSGEIVGVYRKQLLPNYSVFDERRYFVPGKSADTLYEIAGVKVGICICEDAWSPDGPVVEQAAGGAEVMLSLNASPYFAGRREHRQRMLAVRAADASVPFVYVNQVGGQDELVFDGASMVFDAEGKLAAMAAQFAESIMVVDVDLRPSFRRRLLDPRGREPVEPLLVRAVTAAAHSTREQTDIVNASVEPLELDAEMYNALVLGTQDYVRKNGFTDVVLGLSGGVDSSLVATVAVDALGAEHVHGVSMPSRFSSSGSRTDAQQLADNLGIEMRTIPIESPHQSMGQTLKEGVGDDIAGLTDENLQSRLRGITLMALSNEFGWLVLTTGNKSELAVGYSTLYGDSAGGFAVIKDVSKTAVYRLCRWRNRYSFVIPETVLTKAPSAELRPGQRDDDNLPPYDVLDPILEAYVENDQTASEIIENGFDADVVRRVVHMVDLAEYKRRQSPLGVRVTPKAFGKDRRVPITNHYS